MFPYFIEWVFTHPPCTTLSVRPFHRFCWGVCTEIYMCGHKSVETFVFGGLWANNYSNCWISKQVHVCANTHTWPSWDGTSRAWELRGLEPWEGKAFLADALRLIVLWAGLASNKIELFGQIIFFKLSWCWKIQSKAVILRKHCNYIHDRERF